MFHSMCVVCVSMSNHILHSAHSYKMSFFPNRSYIYEFRIKALCLIARAKAKCGKKKINWLIRLMQRINHTHNTHFVNRIQCLYERKRKAKTFIRFRLGEKMAYVFCIWRQFTDGLVACILLLHWTTACVRICYLVPKIYW